MTWLDRYLQKWRIRVARRELPPGARVLDIGTHDGTLFSLTSAQGVGIDPELPEVTSIPGVTLVKGSPLNVRVGGGGDASMIKAMLNMMPKPKIVL